MNVVDVVSVFKLESSRISSVSSRDCHLEGTCLTIENDTQASPHLHHNPAQFTAKQLFSYTPGHFYDSAMAETDVAALEIIIHRLKVERDTWEAVAQRYKAAFKAETNRLQELRDVCFATQAELENERAQQQRLYVDPGVENQNSILTESPNNSPRMQTFGAAVILPPQTIDPSRPQRPVGERTNPLFKRVEQSVAQRNYGTALAEINRLLCGPLSSKARAEGLLLKSNILRASGPDEIYDALAACSEALELCDRLSDLEAFLPRIRYQRGILYYELRLLRQARHAFSTVSDDELLSATDSELRISGDDEFDHMQYAKRRSGFDEQRTGDLLARLEREGLDVSLVGVSSLSKCSRLTHNHLEQATKYECATHAICQTRVDVASLERFQKRHALDAAIVC